MAIDGTWRRDCQLNAISDTDAELTVEGSIQGLNLKEFFLLLSSTGLAYRRCELVRVNGTEMDIRFLRGKHKKRPKIEAIARRMLARSCPRQRAAARKYRSGAAGDRLLPVEERFRLGIRGNQARRAPPPVAADEGACFAPRSWS
jgi:hypothetical protein